MRRMIKGLLLQNSKSNVPRHKTVCASDDKDDDDDEEEEDGDEEDGDDDVIDIGDRDDDDVVNIFYCGIIDMHILQR